MGIIIDAVKLLLENKVDKAAKIPKGDTALDQVKETWGNLDRAPGHSGIHAEVASGCARKGVRD
jgi:hypothetical protein